jgi:hypothetical protein
MLFRYIRLCGTASDTVDAVILLRQIKIGNPAGVQIIEIKMSECLKNIAKITISKT